MTASDRWDGKFRSLFNIRSTDTLRSYIGVNLCSDSSLSKFGTAEAMGGEVS